MNMDCNLTENGEDMAVFVEVVVTEKELNGERKERKESVSRNFAEDPTRDKHKS